MKLVDPTVAAPTRQSRRAPALASLDGLTIGLLSNTKLNADALLEQTAAMLQTRFGGSVLPMVAKGSAGAPAPADTLKNLSEACDYLITASGD